MIIRFACLFLFLAISALTDQRAVRADVRPNILFILTDDQGWPSLESYGGDLVPTPNLERLAADGMRLTDAYVMPQCTPTRAALLTGQHTAKNQMWHVIGWYGTPRAPIAEPMYRLNLQPQQCRLPRWLQQNGYRTGMGGKWHLTNNQHGYYTILRQKSGPLFGFDHVAPPGKGSQNDGDKWVDHLTDDACDFIRRNRDRPWFYYLSHHTLHGKVSAPRPLIDKYSQSGAPKVGMHNATYLAAIEHLDNSVGRLLKTLDETRTADNTLVVFLADNGGVDTQYNLPAWSDDPLDGSRPLSIKEQQYENAPLREGKGSAYEGGIRVPCIVRWPGVIDRGRVETTPVHIVDWLPTLCSAAGCPTKTDEDGEDLTPLFRSKTTSEAISNRSLYWYLPLYDLRWAATPCAVIRRGPWKLIHYFGDSFDKTHQYRIGERSELFNLQEDIGESTDLSLAKPALTAELRSELVQWIQRCSAVVPESNSHNDPEQRLAETREVPAWKLPVHVHPQNAHWFQYGGETIALITSAEHYGAVINRDFDYRTYLKTLADDGMNYTRVFAGSYLEPPGAFGIKRNTLAPKEGRFVAPFRLIETADGIKYDLNTVREEYLQRLDDFVRIARQNGVIVELTFFSSIYSDKQWAIHPFNPANNIQDYAIDDFRMLQTSQAPPRVREIQRSFVTRVVERLNHHSNLFYEIQNEPWSDNHTMGETLNLHWDKDSYPNRVEVTTERAIAWQAEIAAAIHKVESKLPFQHMIAQNVANFRLSLKSDDLIPHATLFNFHYALPEALLWNRGKGIAIGYDESGFSGSDPNDYLVQAWRFVMSGGGLYNNLDYTFTVGHEDGSDHDNLAKGICDPAFRTRLSLLSGFIRQLPLESMKPANQIVVCCDGGTVFALSNRSDCTAAYVEGRSPMNVTFSGKALPVEDPDSATVTAINCLSGEKRMLPLRISADGSLTVPSIPFNHAAIMLRRSPAAP